MTEKPFMTIAEVAAVLEVTPARVYQLVQAGQLPAVRVAGRIRFPRAAFDAWLRTQEELALAAVAQ